MTRYSTNSPDLLATTGPNLMSLESPNITSEPSTSYTSRKDDLSLSDLSLSDQTAIMKKPFSLLARVEQDISTPTRSKASSPSLHDQDRGDSDDEALDDVAVETRQIQAFKLREEKLQSDIFILKKLNASFELFNEALQETGSANERIAAQLEQTDALLNKYIGILSKSEGYSRLIFDEQWQGAEADEERIEQEKQEAKEKARQKAEEEKLRLLQEQARFEHEKQEELKREERQRLEREKSERAIRGGLRGVRGTRTSVRGTRGVASRTDSGAGLSRGIPNRPPSTSAQPSSSAIARPPRAT
ncbi:hypothetical protein GALMADRAFT_248606 [Galerina marginata CBS 339.88]|uniref:DASH complex subunit DUO1 n=1 Tax=Galerina marginata (strain CBS 339.88) TaxID=685588 RepID=A0A067SYA8_GALM3|nr:hypothetical protein GALMADRAFT_248606 [Galerina marginata CBS 339.88]